MAMDETGRDKPGAESRASGSRHTTSRRAGRPGKRRAAAPQAPKETAGPAETVSPSDSRERGNDIPDATDLTQKMAEIARQSQQLVADFLQRQAPENGVGMANTLGIGTAFLEMTAHMLSDPTRLVQAQLSLWNDYLTLWQRTAQRFLGGETEPLIEPLIEDRRFRDAEWTDNALFDFIKQSYLLTGRWMQKTVREVEGIDERTARKIDFYTRQFVDALAPSNFLLTNPE